MVANSPREVYHRRIPMSSPMSPGGRGHDVTSTSTGWGRALLGGLAVLAVSFLGFVYVPNLLINHAFSRTAPRTRDPLVLLWIVVVFVLDSWLFVGLQRFGGRREARG